MAAIAGQTGEGLWHERCAHTMTLCDGAGHEFEEDVAIGGLKGVIIIPVHLKLAVGVLMIVLVGPPAERRHAVTDFSDDVITPHQSGLVIAGLALCIERIG